MPDAPASTETTAPSRFFPVSVETIDDVVLEMDLYIKTGDHQDTVLYRGVGVQFGPDDRERLSDLGVQYLYVPLNQHAQFNQVLTKQLDRTFTDESVSRAERGKIIRGVCSKMIEDLLLFPAQKEAIDSIGAISQQFSRWADQDSEQFSYLLDMSAHDFYTATHMVNVGVGCGLLGRVVRPGDEVFSTELIQGGMLHDIGKRSISERILNKEGKLSPEEWELVKNHPQAGFEYLVSNPTIPATILTMTRDHHERLDGTGYPRGLRAEAITLPARICAIIDVFDALCSTRPYRGPLSPEEVLDIMRSSVRTQFEEELFETWAALIEKCVIDDPRRAAPNLGNGRTLNISDLAQAGPSDPTRPLDGIERDITGEERRRHDRYPCQTSVQALFLRQGKRYPITIGQAFNVRLLDVSRGGAQIRTPWAFAINDALELLLPAGAGRFKKRRVRVVRIRQESGKWHAGVCFTD